MSADHTRAIVRRFYTTVVAAGQLDAIDSFVAPEYVDHNAGPKAGRGPTVVRKHLEALRRTFRDFELKIEDMVVEGDLVATRVTGRGTHLGEWMGIRPTGRVIELRGLNLDRVQGGRIVEHWGEADTVGMLWQMGVDAFAGRHSEEPGVSPQVKSIMLSGVVTGYDPGGNGAHALAELQFAAGKATALSTRMLETAEDVIATLEGLPSLAALGADTLTCWGTGVSAWRPADRWLRERYQAVQKSIISPNGLYGSMGLNGMGVLIAARQQFPCVVITETHPKILYWQLSGKRYQYQTSKAAMDGVLTAELGISVKPVTEHEWDAALSAYAALMGLLGRWTHDLHSLPTNAGERLITPCGKTHYFWPE